MKRIARINVESRDRPRWIDALADGAWPAPVPASEVLKLVNLCFQGACACGHAAETRQVQKSNVRKPMRFIDYPPSEHKYETTVALEALLHVVGRIVDSYHVDLIRKLAQSGTLVLFNR